jgi:lipopolysaccharide biosynthesis glycosyltransferase
VRRENIGKDSASETGKALPTEAALVYCTDEAFLPAACFSIRSVCDVTPRPPTIFVFVTGLSDAERDKADRYLAGFGADIRIQLVDPNVLRWGRTVPSGSRAAYLRLHLGHLVPPEYHRALYLDADTRVMSDLTPLFEKDLGKHTAGACHDVLAFIGHGGLAERRRDCGLRSDQSYFNSGVMLLDMDRWRRNKVGERAIEFSTTFPERCRYLDQCSLNHVLADDWTPIDIRWNFSPKLWEHRAPFVRFRPPPGWVGILHFLTPSKPWHATAASHHVFHNAWYRSIARSSPWPTFASPVPTLACTKAMAVRHLQASRYAIRRSVEAIAPRLLSSRVRRAHSEQRAYFHALLTNSPSSLPNFFETTCGNGG